MIVPKTKDGRVVFMLPWLEQTIAGTTDSSTDITMRPQVQRQELLSCCRAVCFGDWVIARRLELVAGLIGHGAGL
jgi:glycerol-3-phosphate dehydrogenase